MKLVLQVGCSRKCCGILLWAAPTGESAKLVLLQEVLKLLRWAAVGLCWVLRCGPFLEFIPKDLDTLTLLSLKHQQNCVTLKGCCIYFYVPVVNFYVANFFV